MPMVVAGSRRERHRHRTESIRKVAFNAIGEPIAQVFDGTKQLISVTPFGSGLPAERWHAVTPRSPSWPRVAAAEALADKCRGCPRSWTMSAGHLRSASALRGLIPALMRAVALPAVRLAAPRSRSALVARISRPTVRGGSRGLNAKFAVLPRSCRRESAQTEGCSNIARRYPAACKAPSLHRAPPCKSVALRRTSHRR